ncbi:MAG: hypothetical protein HY050_02970 [Actinobacteria bacterium]|nr:hypothetical protein [Actinomycetota bacterium]
MENTKLGPKACEEQHTGRSLSPERRIILSSLRSKKRPIRVQDLALELGFHENTIREHLEGLALSHYAQRVPIPSQGRGRPSQGYQPLDDFISQVEPEAREYASLALVLARQLAVRGQDSKTVAVLAGEAWAEEFKELDTLPSKNAGKSRRRIFEILKALGFSPKSNVEKKLIKLETCPLLAAARREPEIVCSVHLGLIRGLVSHSGGNPNEVKLTQFAEYGSCHLVLP